MRGRGWLGFGVGDKLTLDNSPTAWLSLLILERVVRGSLVEQTHGAPWLATFSVVNGIS
jgi:hypothetical protein